MSLLKRLTMAVALSLLSIASLAMTSTPTYQNMFVAYLSPADVKSVVQYASNERLGGYIFWDVRGDVNPKDAGHSLLLALQQPLAENKWVTAYWADWNVYGTSAIPYAPYAIPGSTTSAGAAATNADLSAKLSHVNQLVYSFLETQSSGEDVGTLYFNDPWSDLLPSDSFCSGNPICTFQVKPGKSFSDSAKMGNFEAFSLLPKQFPTLQTLISVGGYGHDATFEGMFNAADPEAAMNRFVSSALLIMNQYHIDGIDLDYENPGMTFKQSQDFLKLIQMLNAQLQNGQFIHVTILSNQHYVSGDNGVGFAPKVLSAIAALNKVQGINLMTYDYHGAFDYQPGAKARTGFLSNLMLPTRVPSGYNAQFSIKTSVQALLHQGVSAAKIGVGIPSYGRALAGIAEGTQGGLFSVIPSTATVPQGDQDNPGCSMSLPLGSTSCSGVFSYQYIVNHFLHEGFTAMDHSGNGGGSTAYANSWQPAVPADFQLEISNLDSPKGLGIVVTIGDFHSGYLAPHTGDKVYDNKSNPSAASIEGKTGLSVAWSTYSGGPSGTCTEKLDFTKNAHIMINPTAKACDIK